MKFAFLDNGRSPRRISSPLIPPSAGPFGAAILLNTSESMQNFVSASKQIAQRFAEHIFRQESDQAILIDFAYASNMPPMALQAHPS